MRLLIIACAFALLAGLAIAPAAEAGCNEASATARGLNQDDVMARSTKHLERKIVCDEGRRVQRLHQRGEGLLVG